MDEGWGPSSASTTATSASYDPETTEPTANNQASKMPPHEGLVHPKEYDVKDSNVELIGSDIDHQVKYNSAASEPAWNQSQVGKEAGLFIWRIEAFQVVAWPKEKYGQFYDGDSFIILHSYKVGNDHDTLWHDIFFWLGSKTSQDEAGTAAYKTVELDEYLHGKATQHREIQEQPSDEFLALFPHISICHGGVQSGFHHVETEDKSEDVFRLLRIFKLPTAGRSNHVMVYEVAATWESLDENDVFILDKGTKIWVWQGQKCSPMEKAKGAEVVHNLHFSKHIDTEVLSQTESRSRIVVEMLGGKDLDRRQLQAPQPITSAHGSQQASGGKERKLFRLSDASGQLSFNVVKETGPIRMSDLDSHDMFILDTGSKIWVWQGAQASRAEKALWIKVAQSYARHVQEQSGSSNAHMTPISKVVEGNESQAFRRAIEA